MDMCDAYIYAVIDGLPDGQNKIVFDRFHEFCCPIVFSDAFHKPLDAAPDLESQFTWPVTSRGRVGRELLVYPVSNSRPSPKMAV